MERPYQSVVRLPVGAVAGHVGTGGETVHKAGKASLASRHKQHLGNAESRRDESVSRKAA
jgi:hypothetical protein